MPDLLDTRLENRWLVYPNHANNLGTVHDGFVMKWMDQLGAMAAMRFAGRACVTARFDQINFKRPVDVGDITVIEAYVPTFRTLNSRSYPFSVMRFRPIS